MPHGSARHIHAGGDVGRIQREAVASVKEIQNKARAREGEPHFRNWSTEPNVPKENRVPRKAEPPRPSPVPARERPSAQQERRPPPPPPNNGGRKSAYQQARQYGPRREEAPYQPHHDGTSQRRGPEPPPPQPTRRGDTTVLQDILGGIGIDDDRILILGLILILINDKADTTLILALCYLLL